MCSVVQSPKSQCEYQAVELSLAPNLKDKSSVESRAEVFES